MGKQAELAYRLGVLEGKLQYIQGDMRNTPSARRYAEEIQECWPF